MYRPKITLFRTGIASLVLGTALLCTGGYRIANSHYFAAHYLEEDLNAIYNDKDGPKKNIKRIKKATNNLYHDAEIAAAGLGLLATGVVITRSGDRDLFRLTKKDNLHNLPSRYDDRGRSRTGRYHITSRGEKD